MPRPAFQAPALRTLPADTRRDRPRRRSGVARASAGQSAQLRRLQPIHAPRIYSGIHGSTAEYSGIHGSTAHPRMGWIYIHGYIHPRPADLQLYILHAQGGSGASRLSGMHGRAYGRTPLYTALRPHERAYGRTPLYTALYTADSRMRPTAACRCRRPQPPLYTAVYTAARIRAAQLYIPQPAVAAAVAAAHPDPIPRVPYLIHYSISSIIQPALFSIQSALFSIQSALFSIQSALFSIQSALFSIQSALFSIQSALFSIQSALFSIQSALFSIQSALFSSPRPACPDARAAPGGAHAAALCGAAHALAAPRIREVFVSKHA